MDSKTVTTVLLVVICVLLFPMIIGVIGGFFGMFGSIIGGLFGIIGGLLGAIFGAIGSIFGAIFGVFGWLIDEPFRWALPWNHFDRSDFLLCVAIVLIIVLLTRSKAVKTGKRP